jgi:shikimate kinase
VIYLQVSVKELCRRLTLDQNNRPMYNDVSENKIVSQTRNLFKKRHSTYMKSDVVIDSSYSVEEVLDKILSVIA